MPSSHLEFVLIIKPDLSFSFSKKNSAFLLNINGEVVFTFMSINGDTRNFLSHRQTGLKSNLIFIPCKCRIKQDSL